MRKELLLIAFLLVACQNIFAATPEVTITSPASGTFWNNGQHSVLFNVKDSDVNGQTTRDLRVQAWYSSTPGAFENYIGDFNLMQGAYCGSNDFTTEKPCGISWSTSVSDTNYFIDLNVFDIDSSTSIVQDFNLSSSASFMVDNVKPTALADYDANWQNFEANVLFTCSDAGSGCASITVNGAPFAGDSVSVLFSSDANHTVAFHATDRSGNASDENTIYVLVDKAAPAVSNKSPANGTSTNDNTPTISFDVSDSGSGIDLNAETLRTAIDGILVPFDSLAISGSNVSYTLASHADGTVMVDANVVDKLGNKKEESWSFAVDTTAPATTAGGCSNAWNILTQTMLFSCADSGGSGCKYSQYSLDGGAWNTSSTFDISTDLNHKVDFRSLDQADNIETQKTLYCAIDKTVPTVTLNTPTTSGRTISISWSGSDASGSGILSYYFFRGDTQIYSGTATSYEDGGLAYGTYSYKIKVRDNAGNESGFSPVVSVTTSESSPAAITTGGNTSGTRSVFIKLSISIPDFVKAASVPITINGDEAFEQGYQIKIKPVGSNEYKNVASASAYTGKSFTANYDFSGSADGNATITAVVWSSTGAREEQSKTVTVDSKAPSIGLLAPEENASVSKTTELRASAADSPAGVKQIAFHYRKGASGEWTAIGVGTKLEKNEWVQNWNTSGLADAKYQLKAVAMDFAGNTSEKAANINVSNLAGLGFTGTVTVEGVLSFDSTEAEIDSMLGNALKADFAAASSKLVKDNNVSRTLKIIKVVDGNSESYRASMFITFRNNSSENASFQLVEAIPKEFAQSSDEIESSEQFAILEKDPIISWSIENIRPGKEIEIVYSLKNPMTRETAMSLLDSNLGQKFLAPPILSLSSSPLAKSSFTGSFSNQMPSGFLGLSNTTWLAIIVGIIVAALIASALYFRSGTATVSGAQPVPELGGLSYSEPWHKGIVDKISGSLGEFIGSNNSTQSGKKWIYRKEEPGAFKAEKTSGGLAGVFKGIDFTMVKKTEKQKPEGKGKWASRLDNSDI